MENQQLHWIAEQIIVDASRWPRSGVSYDYFHYLLTRHILNAKRMEDMDIQFYFLTANVLLIIVSKRKEHLSQHWTGCHDSDYWKLIYGTMA